VQFSDKLTIVMRPPSKSIYTNILFSIIMPDLSNISVKERNAEYFHESFERFYRSGNYSEACLSLWKALELIIAGIASFENKEIKTLAETKLYLQKFVQNGEIRADELSALDAIYANRLRDCGDETMLAIKIERSENLFRKLKKILKDYIINGPPKEPTGSALEGTDNGTQAAQDSSNLEGQDYGQTNNGENYNERLDR
jgi:hypothetical protein